MKNECSIIRDLLPLYAENLVSSETADFVKEHLDGCETCKKEFERLREPEPSHEVPNPAPLLKISRKMKAKRIQTIALTVIFVAAIFVSAFAVLDAPIYPKSPDGIVSVSQSGDNGMILTFDEKVTDFDYTVYDDPDGGNFSYCEIRAWTSLLDKWFSKGKGTLSATVTTRDEKPVIAAYVPNNGDENVFLAKFDPNSQNKIDTNFNYESTLVLPRMSLGYYLVMAITAFVALVIVCILIRKKAGVRVWAERITLYPVAYIVAHCIVTGINWTSYSLPRDFSLIIFISILLYGGLLLIHNICRLKKEINEINK